MKKENSFGVDPSNFATLKIPSPAEQSAMNLRALMLSKNGDEKCILCKAADELEKTAINPNTGSLDWMWIFLIIMLFSGWCDMPNISAEVMKEVMDVIGNGKKVEDENNG